MFAEEDEVEPVYCARKNKPDGECDPEIPGHGDNACIPIFNSRDYICKERIGKHDDLEGICSKPSEKGGPCGYTGMKSDNTQCENELVCTLAKDCEDEQDKDECRKKGTCTEEAGPEEDGPPCKYTGLGEKTDQCETTFFCDPSNHCSKQNGEDGDCDFDYFCVNGMSCVNEKCKKSLEKSANFKTTRTAIAAADHVRDRYEMAYDKAFGTASDKQKLL